jgi:hypothetical protein
MFRYLIVLVLVFIWQIGYSQAISPGVYYVTVDELNERLAPSLDGKVTNTIYKNQKVSVSEVQNGWARVSRYYDGEVEGVTGPVARWVFAKYLSEKNLPEEKPKKTNSVIGQAIKTSDDFVKYEDIFISTSQELIESGKCTLGEFKEMGGWWRSANHKPRKVYFTYCGGVTKNNRLYLDVSTGTTFK